MLSAMIMMVAVIPFAPFRFPFLAFVAWSIGWHFIERRFLYKLILIYSMIFTMIMFPLDLAVLQTIDSVLITPFVQGRYPMILTWFFWILFFASSVGVQWILTVFWAYIIERYTGKWMDRIPMGALPK